MQIAHAMNRKKADDQVVTRAILKQELKRELTEESGEFEKRLDQRLEVRFSAIESRFSVLDRRFVDLERTVDDGHESLKSYVGVLMEDVLHKMDLILEGFDSQGIHLGSHEKRITALETEIPLLKAAIIYRK